MSTPIPPVHVHREPLAGRRALVAESVARTRTTLRDAVAGLGAEEIVCFERGSDVLEELRCQTYDLVVCGQVYGDGLDSAMVLERIREHRLLPMWGTLVAIAAERTHRSVTGLAAHALDACILKPFSTGQVRERLLSVVNYKRRLEPIMTAVDNGDCEMALAGCRILEARATDLKAAGYRAICERLINERQADRAESVLEEAMGFGEAPWMALAQARIRLMQGQGAQAKQLLKKLVDERPEFIASYDALASIEAASGEFLQAVRHLQEANARTGFSLRRLRRTGEYAARGGELLLAERTLDRVMDKVYDSDLAEGSDYVNLVEVLAARGKLKRAEQVANELRRAHSEHPDSLVVGPLVAYRRAFKEGDPRECASTLAALLEALQTAGSEVSVEVRIQVLEACVEQQAREEALEIARGIALTGHADRLKLRRVRELLDRGGRAEPAAGQ